jgi:SnoaL-like domain
MGTEQNKSVVSRFMNEVTTGRNLDPELIDELCAPNYINVALGGADLDTFKTMGRAMIALLADARVDDLELVAEGDAVFARFNHTGTLPDGSTTTARGMAYYGLADGKIVINDVMFVPDLMVALGPFMAPPAQS